MPQETLECEERAAWPYASLLLFGFFGTGDSAGKRLAGWTTGALILFGVAMLSLEGVYALPVPDTVAALAVPGAVLMIVWAYKDYLGKLDELSRRIQLEAFAWAYGAAFVVLFGLFAMNAATGAYFHPLWVIVAEPFRGIALALIARRYA